MKNTEKIEFNYQIEKNGGGNIKAITRVLELDHVAIRELRTSGNRKEVIQGLVGQFHPNYHVISGSIKSLTDDSEEENRSSKKKSRTKENDEVYQQSSGESKSIWRKPYFLIPLRISWAIIVAFFTMLFSLLEVGDNSK